MSPAVVWQTHDLEGGDRDGVAARGAGRARASEDGAPDQLPARREARCHTGDDRDRRRPPRVQDVRPLRQGEAAAARRRRRGRAVECAGPDARPCVPRAGAAARGGRGAPCAACARPTSTSASGFPRAARTPSRALPDASLRAHSETRSAPVARRCLSEAGAVSFRGNASASRRAGTRASRRRRVAASSRVRRGPTAPAPAGIPSAYRRISR